MASKPAANTARPRDVVVYDGECNLCTQGVLRLQKWDWSGRFDFLSLHSPEVVERFPDLNRGRATRT